MGGEKTVIHIDMDAFFASVEERDNPHLKKGPVGVIGAGTRTVLVTASYKAREFGVKTGMNIPQARALCPHITLVKANHEKYTAICGEIAEILDGFSPLVEIFSIDEFFLDATGLFKLFGPPLELARRIKKRIKEKTCLAASIGIAENKLLAKLASDLCKPDGIKQIRPNEANAVLDGLPVEKICGIGKKTKDVLNKLNITTCGALARADRQFLKNRFGAMGERLYHMSRGMDNSPVVSFRKEIKEKSMGHSITLTHDIKDKKELLKHILKLSDMVGARLRRQSITGATIAVTIRYRDFKTFQKQKTIQTPTNNTKIIYCTAGRILNSIRLKDAVRLVGVSVHSLRKSFPVFSLFKEDEKSRSLDRARDIINNIFGSDTIQFASIAGLVKHDKVISPSWRPHGARRY